MSHFAVAVITDDVNKLKEMLAPYDENIEVSPYIDETKEEIISKGKERKQRVLKRKEDGKELDEWDLKYLNANTDEELYKAVVYDDETYDEQRKSFNNI